MVVGAAEPYFDFVGRFSEGLGSLEDLDRRAYVLTEVRGLTDREAADVLGMSHMTINRRAERARNHLKEALGA